MMGVVRSRLAGALQLDLGVGVLEFNHFQRFRLHQVVELLKFLDFRVYGLRFVCWVFVSVGHVDRIH